MRRKALDSLRSAIEANTERRSLEDLRAQGKKHVRVVSGEKVMQIIKAIVADIIDREVGAVSKRDRDRIVDETKDQFDRVLKMQTDSDALIGEQKQLVAEWRERAQKVNAERESLRAQIEELRSEQAAREGKMLAEYQARVQELSEKARNTTDESGRIAADKERLERTLEEDRRNAAEREARQKADFDARLAELHAEQRDLVARLEGERGELAGRQEQAIKGAQARIEELQAQLGDATEGRASATARAESLESDASESRTRADEAAGKLSKAERIIHKLDTRLQNTRTTIENYDKELQRVIVERDQLKAELAAAREKAGESDAVAAMRGEMDEMRGFLTRMEEKSGTVNEETLNSLVSQISDRDSVSGDALEAKFSESLDASLDKITKAMELATAKPIDVQVEATDVLIDSLFDLGDDVMSSNMDELEVETRTSAGGGISGHLEALKALRTGTPAPQEEEDNAEAESLIDDLLGDADGNPDGNNSDSNFDGELNDTPTTAAEGKHHGAAAEPAAMSGAAKDKINASMERLKAVREASENTD